jgi:cytochrome P450
VISLVLGIPPEMRDTLKRWSDDFIAAQAGNITAERVASAATSTVEFEHYISDLLEERAAAPDLCEQPDFLSRLIVEGAGTEEFAPLTRQEQLSLVQQMLVGGNETTTNLLGNAMSVLLTHPEWAGVLRQDSGLVQDFVEEVLRYESPLQGLYRVAVDDTTVQGVEVPAGAKLMVLFGSANRDEQVYAPDGFDPTRDNRSRPHIAFGRGTHACMGQGVARKEVAIAITRLIKRLDNIQPVPDRPGRPVELFGFHGRRALEITFTPISAEDQTRG